MAQPEYKPIYVEIFKDGTPPLRLEAAYNALGALSSGRWVISIKKYRKTRSTKQNAFYWDNFVASQIECFQERWGETYSSEAVHNWNKINFWGDEKVLNEETGEVIRTPATSTDKTTVEWELKLEQMRQWFRQNMDWELPFPNEQLEAF